MQKFLLATVATLTIGLTGAQAAMRVAPLPPVRPAQNTAMEQAGTLSCMVQSGVGYVVGSSRTAVCTFDHPGAHFFTESYDAKLSRVGFDVGVMPKQAMRWAVYTPGGYAEPGMLIGAHTGASSEATVGIGEGGKVALQSGGTPIVFEQMKAPMAFGVSLGVGSANLELTTPTTAPVAEAE